MTEPEKTSDVSWMNYGTWKGHEAPNKKTSQHFVLRGTKVALCGLRVPLGQPDSTAPQCRKCQRLFAKEIPS